MLSNAGVVLRGSSVCLVPYRREHVRTYHGWMQAEDMLAHTCSERLTLQEELDNQRSWHQERGPRLASVPSCCYGRPGRDRARAGLARVDVCALRAARHALDATPAGRSTAMASVARKPRTACPDNSPV
jgi:hypothetical protein